MLNGGQFLVFNFASKRNMNLIIKFFSLLGKVQRGPLEGCVIKIFLEKIKWYIAVYGLF